MNKGWTASGSKTLTSLSKLKIKGHSGKRIWKGKKYGKRK